MEKIVNQHIEVCVCERESDKDRKFHFQELIWRHLGVDRNEGKELEQPKKRCRMRKDLTDRQRETRRQRWRDKVNRGDKLSPTFTSKTTTWPFHKRHTDSVKVKVQIKVRPRSSSSSGAATFEATG